MARVGKSWAAPGGGRNKFSAQSVEVDGIRFASKREARRWSELRLLERAGKIENLRRQEPFALMGAQGPLVSDSGRALRYVADFTYFDVESRATVIEDAKGYGTDVYRLKKAIMRAQGFQIREV